MVGRLAGIEDGEVDDQEQADAEEGRVGGHAAGLEAAQQGPDGGGQPRQAAHDEAGDDELVHEVDDGGQGALDAPDQHLVIEPVNVEAVGEGAGNGVAGELGHIPVMNSEEECPCGNTGCIEIYASGKNLQNILKENFPEDKIDDIFVKHGDNEIIKKYIDTLALPIATEINIFDPDYIIIAGGVPMMKGFPRDYLDKCIYKYARKPYPAENLNIIYSEHDQKSGVLGAAYYIRNIIS